MAQLKVGLLYPIFFKQLVVQKPLMVFTNIIHLLVLELLRFKAEQVQLNILWSLVVVQVVEQVAVVQVVFLLEQLVFLHNHIQLLSVLAQRERVVLSKELTVIIVYSDH
jgi:hypothetical protein